MMDLVDRLKLDPETDPAFPEFGSGPHAKRLCWEEYLSNTPKLREEGFMLPEVFARSSDCSDFVDCIDAQSGRFLIEIIGERWRPSSDLRPKGC